MKFPALVFALCLLAGRVIAEDPKPATIVTLSGVKYEKAVVTGLAPDAISVTHSTGVARIPFTDLPVEIQKQYGYDAAKAIAYQQAVVDFERARAAAKKHAEQVEWTRKEQEEFRRQREIRDLTEPVYYPPRNNEELLKFILSQHPHR
jgi:hypothetical protein